MIELAQDNDDIPTMGEEAEAELKKWVCVCGQPELPGVLHSRDKDCREVHEVTLRMGETP